MKHLPTLRDDRASLASTPSGVFLEVVRDEQTRFLDTVRAAGSTVRDEPGQLAFVAAIQTRLTQQFFDAQRAILHRQAAIDAEVNRIDATAAALAEPDTVRLRAVAGPTGQPPSPGSAIVRHGVDAAIADVDDAAFEPVEIDPMLPQQQLSALLEQWWARLNDDGRTMVERAHARARLERHVATIAAGGGSRRMPGDEPGNGAVPARNASASTPAMATTVPASTTAGLALPPPAVPPRLAPPRFAPPRFAPPTATDARRLTAQPLMAQPLTAEPPVAGRPSTETGPAPSTASSPRSPSAPTIDLGTLLGAIGTSDLAALLDTLARQLAPVETTAVEVDPIDDLVIRMDRWDELDRPSALARLEALGDRPRAPRRQKSTALAVPEPGVDDSLAAEGTGLARRTLDQVPVRVVVPMLAATSALTLVMALVG